MKLIKLNQTMTGRAAYAGGAWPDCAGAAYGLAVCPNTTSQPHQQCTGVSSLQPAEQRFSGNRRMQQ